MKCIRCGRNVGSDGFCTACGFMNKHISKAYNTADYYYNLGLEKAQMRDLSGAEMYLTRALYYNKEHKNARNLLGLVYNEIGEGGKAYIQWKISSRYSNAEENIANSYIRQMEEHPAIFEQVNETAKKFNLALNYAKQGSDDLAMIQIKKVLSLTPNFVSGHLLFALLHMRAGESEAAKNDLSNALAVDHYNTTARYYLSEMGEPNEEVAPEKVPVESLKPDNENLKNVRPVDHYEDPNKETWKQFVYMLIGLAIGVVAMFVLVIPSVRAGVSVDYNNLKKQYKATVQNKNADIKQLEEDKANLQKKNKQISKSLSVYEGSQGEDSMYDSLLKALQEYEDNDNVNCAKYLSKIKKDALPSKTSKDLYQKMSDDALPSAAKSLYDSGLALYKNYKYADAQKDLESSYKYVKSYETEFYLAMCLKQTGGKDKATKYFYDIINNSGNNDLVVKSANFGLEMLKSDAIEAAAKAAGKTTSKSDTEKSSEDSSKSSTTEKTSDTKSSDENSNESENSDSSSSSDNNNSESEGDGEE